MTDSKVSRRDLLTAGLALGSAAALTGPAAARTLRSNDSWISSESAIPEAANFDVATAPSFLTAEERAFLDAAVARLIPADDLGPGAKEAGVTSFLDRQLAGAYGRAEGLYVQGPWHEGTPSQGYQSRFTPAQLYRSAIQAIDEHCKETFSNKTFAALSAEDQDKVLTSLEKGELALEGLSSKTFFEVLMQNTIEGFFSDPIYGGNRDMVGWKLIGFPGARYDYRDYVAKHGEKFPLPPVGLRGRPDWSPKG